jgi:guanylate kinase
MMMVRKKAKKALSKVRPVVSLRVRPAMYEDLVREANKRQLKLSEEIERRLIHYEEMIADASEVDDATLGAWLNSDRNDMIDKLAERIARKLKQKTE